MLAKLILLALFCPALVPIPFVLLTGILSYFLQKKSSLGSQMYLPVMPPITISESVRVMLREWYASSLWVYSNILSRLFPRLFSESSTLPQSFILQQQRVPIFLVHGYLDTTYNWRQFIFYCQQLGIGPLFPIALKSLFASLKTLAQELQEKLEPVSNLRKYLIGFSMGGLLAAYYNEYLAKRPCEKIITIASPLQGTYLAAMMPGENAREMRRMSPVLIDLCERMRRNSYTQYYHIASRDDNIILPWQSAVLEPKKPDRLLVLSGFGHATLLRSRNLVEVVKQCLEEPPKREQPITAASVTSPSSF